MNLYEFITPSDPITFYAVDDSVAEAVTFLIGNGKAGLRSVDGREMPPTILIFLGLKGEQKERFVRTTRNRREDILISTKTFAVCEPEERDIYDEYTNNGKDEEKVKKWADKKTSSLTDWCRYAWTFDYKPITITDIKGGD